MKNVFSSLVVAFLIIVTLKAQPNLYGTTFLGGNFNKGALFTYAPATNTYTKLHDFAGFDGTYPDCSLIQAIDGKLYGTTLEGGATNHGILFSFDPATNTFVKRHDFTCQGGAKPLGDLVQASDGKLYGTTVNEGSTGYGVLYSFDPVSNAYAQLLEFTGPNGAFAHGNLIESSNKLFGTTEGGGTSGGGILFSYDPATNTFTKLHDYLLKEDGFDSRAKLVQASDGKLYGSTSLGGTTLFGYGVLFSFDPLSNTYTNLHHFNGLDGDNPLGGLVEAKNGELYGTTQHGGSDSVGVLFSFAPATNFYTKLHDFTGLDGKNPNGDLVSATDGNLYGMTTDGGTNNEGVIFSFNPVTNSFIKQHDFTGPDGSQPTSGLLEIKHIFPL